MEQTAQRLRDGRTVHLRAVRPGDRFLFEQGFERLSEDSRQRRFFRAVKQLTAAELDYFTQVDHHDHVAIGATIEDGSAGLGVARYIRLGEDSDTAEVAIVVLDAVQGQGLGRLLMEALAHAARDRGVHRFVAQTGADNEPFVRLMERLGEVERQPVDSGTLELAVELA